MSALQTTYLALGSNVSPRKHHILTGLRALKRIFPVDFISSSLYLTKPYGGMEQSSYINCCASFKTEVEPLELLRIGSDIELQLGRERDGSRWQSRTLDIDILLYGEQRVESKALTIPHYDLLNRDFFIIPLLEIRKDLKHPFNGESFRCILKEIDHGKRTSPRRLFFPDI